MLSTRLCRRFSTTRPTQFELSSVLVPIHDGMQMAHSSGLAWHTVIPLTAIALRSTVTLPLSIMSRVRSRKQAELQPLLSATSPILKAKLASSQSARDGALTMDQIDVLVNKERRRRRVDLFKRYKCQTWKNVAILPTVQIPLWFSLSLVIRSMCGWAPVDGIGAELGLQNDSFIWCHDLMAVDPYGALPMILGAVSLLNMEWNARMINASKTRTQSELTIPNVLSAGSKIGSIFIMTIAFQAPTALCLYWVASNGFSLAQNMLLDWFLPVRYQPPCDLDVSSKLTDITVQEPGAEIAKQ